MVAELIRMSRQRDGTRDFDLVGYLETLVDEGFSYGP